VIDKEPAWYLLGVLTVAAGVFFIVLACVAAYIDEDPQCQDHQADC